MFVFCIFTRTWVGLPVCSNANCHCAGLQSTCTCCSHGFRAVWGWAWYTCTVTTDSAGHRGVWLEGSIPAVSWHYASYSSLQPGHSCSHDWHPQQWESPGQVGSQFKPHLPLVTIFCKAACSYQAVGHIICVISDTCSTLQPAFCSEEHLCPVSRTYLGFRKV